MGGEGGGRERRYVKNSCERGGRRKEAGEWVGGEGNTTGRRGRVEVSLLGFPPIA